MSLIDKVLKYGANVALPVEAVDERTKAIRLAICRACPRFNYENGKCLECGCYMEVKAGTKTHRNPKRGMRVEITHCPLGRWMDDEVANFYNDKND